MCYRNQILGKTDEILKSQTALVRIPRDSNLWKMDRIPSLIMKLRGSGTAPVKMIKGYAPNHNGHWSTNSQIGGPM